MGITSYFPYLDKFMFIFQYKLEFRGPSGNGRGFGGDGGSSSGGLGGGDNKAGGATGTDQNL